MEIWQKKGGTSRDQERSSWSNRDADSQSFNRSEKRGIGGQYKGYSVTNQTPRKETTIFAKPNEPYYKSKQDTKFERNVSSHDDNPHRDSFSLLNRSSLSKIFDYRGEKFASEAYGKGETLGTKRYIAQDISDFDIEPYAMPDKSIRRDSYILQDRKIGSGPYNSPDRKVDSGPYISQDRKNTSESYRQVTKLGDVPFVSQDRTMSQRHQISQDDNFGSVPYKSHSTFSIEPFGSQQEKLDSRAYHSRDSYSDTREKNLGNAPHISQNRNFSGLQVTHERNVDGRPYDSQTTSLINETYISKDQHPRSRPYNTLDKNIVERPYISENVNIGEVTYGAGDRKHSRGPDNSLYRDPSDWHQDIEGNQIKIRSQISQERDLDTKLYTSQDRRQGSSLHSSHETSLRNISYISQDKNFSSRIFPSQGRKLDGGPYDSPKINFTSDLSYAEEINANRKLQELTPNSRPYYLQDKTKNDRPLTSQDRGPRVLGDPFPSSGRTFYSSKSRDEPLTEREAFNTQGRPSFVNELDGNLQQFNKKPTYANRPVSNNVKPRLYDNEPQSHGRKPAALVDNPRSYDTRPKPYGNKRPSVETERSTFIDNTSSPHERPSFRNIDNRSSDKIQRSFDNKPERFDKKHLFNDNTSRSFGDKPRSYDNRPGLRDKEKRLDGDIPRLFDKRLDHVDDGRLTLAEASVSFGDKRRSYDNRPGLHDKEKRLDDHIPQLFDKRPERVDEERPTLAEASLSSIRKQRSYDNRPGLGNIEERSDEDNRRSFDNRPEQFGSKRPFRDSEPGSFVGKPRYYDNRPDFRDKKPTSEDRFDNKRLFLDNKPPSLIKKPRFYDNKPGIRDIKQRSENDNQRSFDNRPEKFDEKRLPQNNEPRYFISKPKSYDNRPKIRDMEPENRRSYDNQLPLFDKHRSDDSFQQSRFDKPRSYDNRPAFRNKNPRSIDSHFRANTWRSGEKPKIVLKRKFQSGLKPLMGTKVRFPERKDLKKFSVPPKIVLKRKFEIGLKPLMGNKVRFPERKDPTRFIPSLAGPKRKFQPLASEARPSKKLIIPNRISITLASKAIHNEVVNGYVFATCSNDDILHKMVVFLIRMRMRKIVAAGGGAEIDSDTLVQKYRNRHPSVLDYIMAESISLRLDGETELNKEAITLAEWKILIKQFSNVFPKEHFKLLTKKSPQKLEVGKQKITKKNTAQVQSEVETQHPLTTDDIDIAIDTRTTDIMNLMFEVAEEDSTTDPVIEFVDRKILEGGAEQIKTLLTRTLSTALIRPDADEEFLMLRIFGNPKLPSLQQLERWLEPYHLRQIKKTFKSKNVCIARVKNRKAYNALLALNSPVVAGIPLTIKTAGKITSPNMGKYLRKNKTWVNVVSKSEQQMKLRNRLARENSKKAAIEDENP